MWVRKILIKDGSNGTDPVTSEPCGLERADVLGTFTINLSVTSEPCGLESYITLQLTTIIFKKTL